MGGITDFDFSNNEYKKTADTLIQTSKQGNVYTASEHTVSDAFMLLIKDLDEDELDNLCDILHRKYGYPEEECYNLTQRKGKLYEENGQIGRIIGTAIYDCAKECMKVGKNVGNKKVGSNQQFDATSWISHSLYEAKLAAELANACGLEPKKAEMLGLLHDIGRKKTHGFDHTIRGFELLVDEGWVKEAPITLTHSFLNGIGATLFDTKTGGSLIIDMENMQDDPKSIYKDIGPAIGYKHDMARFVENYKYTDYDRIVNVADLMTLDNSIESPYDRVQELITRKTPDHNYRLEFLSDYINTLNEFLVRLGVIAEVKEEDKANPNQGMTALMEIFKGVSDIFYGHYCEKIQGKGIGGDER